MDFIKDTLTQYISYFPEKMYYIEELMLKYIVVWSNIHEYIR